MKEKQNYYHHPECVGLPPINFKKCIDFDAIRKMERENDKHAKTHPGTIPSVAR